MITFFLDFADSQSPFNVKKVPYSYVLVVVATHAQSTTDLACFLGCLVLKTIVTRSTNLHGWLVCPCFMLAIATPVLRLYPTYHHLLHCQYLRLEAAQINDCCASHVCWLSIHSNAFRCWSPCAGKQISRNESTCGTLETSNPTGWNMA